MPNSEARVISREAGGQATDRVLKQEPEGLSGQMASRAAQGWYGMCGVWIWRGSGDGMGMSEEQSSSCISYLLLLMRSRHARLQFIDSCFQILCTKML